MGRILESESMNKYLLGYMAFCLMALLAVGCNDSESDLLEAKVYFEEREHRIEVEESETMTCELRARVSALCDAQVELSYEVAGADVVEAYNKKYGTEYEVFDATAVDLGDGVATVPAGEVYAGWVSVKFARLDKVEEGKSYLLPVRVRSLSLPVSQGGDIIYFIIHKPVQIMKVARMYDSYVRIPLLPGTLFTSVTYEALIYVNNFGKNNTIMGREGTLILRIGDDPLLARDRLQIAGKSEYSVSQALETGKWYHVAFTYDQPTGKTAILINGEKASEAVWGIPNFDFGKGDFFIGKVAEFKWGERPFFGRMSEVRLWNVSRTESQIKENMIAVDPKTKGLVAYYKLNGTDQFQEGETWKVKDASGHGMDGLVNGGEQELDVVDLDEPITVK